MFDFGSANIAVYGLGTVGLVGLITLLFNKFGSKSKEQRAVEHAQHEDKQIRLQDEIEVIDKKQKVIHEQIKVAEQAQKVSKTKIDNIMTKATKDISTILKQDNLVIIDKTIQDEWDDI